MPTPRKHPNRAHRQRAYRERRQAACLAQAQAQNMPPGAPIPTMPSSARWRALIERARESLQTVRDEMQSYRDERSETWQHSDKGEAFQERIDQVGEAIEVVEVID